MDEAREHRHDRHVAAASEEVAQEHGLELDRVLVAVRQLGGEAVLSCARGDRLDEIDVDGRGAERRVVRLAREREWMRHPCVAGSEDHEDIRRAALGEVAVAPRIGRAAAMEIDVRCDERADRRASPRRAVDRSRPLRRGEEAVDHRGQRRRISRIRAARVAGRPHRRRQERAVDVGTPRLEARSLEKPVLVERLRQLLHAREVDVLAALAQDRLLDRIDVVRAVEERDDLEQRHRQHHDGGRVAGGIAQRQVTLAVVLDGERLDAAQARSARGAPVRRPAHGSRYANAAAT